MSGGGGVWGGGWTPPPGIPAQPWVRLTAAERAIYLELDHHLQALDMRAKKTIKGKQSSDGDREKRLRSGPTLPARRMCSPPPRGL